MTAIDPGVVGYLRLSREEERERGVSMDEKIQLRRQILLTIAKFNNVVLDESQIVVELKSGGSLSERCALLGILDRCRARELHTVVAFDIDRLTRDVADLKTITQAFFRGAVTLVTQRGVHQFDRNYDTTLIQILAVLGEKERRSFSFRRKAANEQRARSGQLSQGYAPYGYCWDPEHHCYTVSAAEYSIVEEIFARFWSEGCNALVKDLNARGVPAPSVGKRDNASPLWLRGSLRNITANPFYTGHLVKRRDVDRDGEAQPIPRSQWIWSEPLQTIDESGEWAPLPHPVSLEEWERLQEVRADRRVGRPTRGLLTGLLRCSAGQPMHQHLAHYSCSCNLHGQRHEGNHIIRATVERLVWQAVAGVIEPLAARPLPKRRTDAAEAQAARLDSDRRQAQRELREKEETLQDLISRSAFYRRLPHYGTAGPDGRSTYDKTVESLAAQCAALKVRVDQIADKLQSAEIRTASPVLAEFARAGGTVEQLRRAPVETQRQMLHLVVKGVRLEPPATGGMTRGLHVELFQFSKEQPSSITLRIEHPRLGVKRGPYRPKPV